MKRIFVLSIAAFFILGIGTVHGEIVDFEDLSLEAESYWSGSDCSGGFTSVDVFFANNYDPNWGSWDGFSYSNMTDTNTSGWESQFNAITGAGVEESSNYVVSYYNSFTQIPPTLILAEEQDVSGAYFTNTNYTYYSMLNGDMFAKKFEATDWFILTITGKDSQGNITGSVDVFLAEGQDILNTWEWKDLSSLGQVKSLEFTLSSSDHSEWGMNTPAYFCMDNLQTAKSEAIENPATTASETDNSEAIENTEPLSQETGISTSSENSATPPPETDESESTANLLPLSQEAGGSRSPDGYEQNKSNGCFISQAAL